MRFYLLLIAFLAAGAQPLDDIRRRGAALEAARQWPEAVALYEDALTRAGQDPDRLWLLTSLADLEFQRQDYARCERWLRQADRLVDALPADAPERLRIRNALGTLRLVEGNLTAAERELSAAARLAAAAPPVDRAAVLHNLAAVEMHLRHLPEAAAHETEALDLWRSLLGEQHPDVLKAWIGLSTVQALSEDWPAAERSLRRVLAVEESQEALANYAVVLEKLKRPREAKSVRSRLRQSAFPATPVVDVKGLPSRTAPSIRSR